jgi:YgiT-type zinc finger domain-containing protein
MDCPICGVGELQNKEIDTWIRRGGKWALVINQAALVCDNCGDSSFSEDDAHVLARLSDESIHQIPTGMCYVQVFDRRQMAEDQARGWRPEVNSTEPMPPNLPPFSTVPQTFDTSSVKTRSDTRVA